jgi:hypothetical protein
MSEESFAQRTARAAYEEGRAKGRTEERAAVVAWLRRDTTPCAFGPQTEADFIERGEHLSAKRQEKQESKKDDSCVYCGITRKDENKYDCKGGRFHAFETK